MKIILFVVLLIHSLIHLLGFVKGYGLAQIPSLKMQIKKSFALLWLVSFLLFFLSAILLIFKLDYWQISLLISIIISQLLIIKYWKDAKFGTIINVIFIIILIPSLANLNFENQVRKEINEFKNKALSNEIFAEKNDIKSLPEIIQKWIIKSRILDKKGIKLVHLKQIGKMKTDKKSNWMNFTAEQYFNLINPSFLWIADVKMNPLIYFRGKDKLENAVGQMEIKFLSFINVVNVANNNKVNTGAMLRYLAELVWFPEAALNNYCVWESISDTVVKAILTHSGLSVTGTFYFNKTGDFKSFEAKRFYGANDEAQEELWKIDALNYKDFQGVKIPYKHQVTWKLKDGNFTWLILEIKGINYFN